jgi:hypothetical protein
MQLMPTSFNMHVPQFRNVDASDGDGDNNHLHANNHDRDCHANHYHDHHASTCGANDDDLAQKNLLL